MNDLAYNFKLGRGDLIYGFDAARNAYIQNSVELGFAVLTGGWIVANDFNDNTILKFDQFYTPNAKEVKDEDQILAILDALKQQGKLKEGEPFVRALYAKYPPSTVKNYDAKKLARSGDSPFFKMVRRSCKFGIQYVTEILQGGAKVHFILDYMPSEDVILGKKKLDDKGKESKQGRVPITVSELRFVFRNWSRLQSRIIFYKHLQKQAFAPWEINPAGWKKYALERYEKYCDLALKQNRKDLIQYLNTDKASIEDILNATDKLKAGLGIKKEAEGENPKDGKSEKKDPNEN